MRACVGYTKRYVPLPIYRDVNYEILAPKVTHFTEEASTRIELRVSLEIFNTVPRTRNLQDTNDCHDL